MAGPDPGPCPICGAAHTGCTAVTGPVMIEQLPARDAGAVLSLPPLVAEVAQTTLPPGEFTTATYRRARK